MNNYISLMFTVFSLLLISTVARGIGLTSDVIETPKQPETLETSGFLDTLGAVVSWVFNQLSSLFQILTFQVDLPTILNTLIFVPISFGIIYLVVTIVRGGAG